MYLLTQSEVIRLNLACKLLLLERIALGSSNIFIEVELCLLLEKVIVSFLHQYLLFTCSCVCVKLCLSQGWVAVVFDNFFFRICDFNCYFPFQRNYLKNTQYTTRFFSIPPSSIQIRPPIALLRELITINISTTWTRTVPPTVTSTLMHHYLYVVLLL